MEYRYMGRAISVKYRPPLRLLVWLVLLAGGAVAMTSQARAAVDACCVITAIDPASGLVTAREEAVGRGFQFKLNEAGLLGSLHVGQPVYANYARRLVSLDGSRSCGTIVTLQSLAQATQGGSSAGGTVHAAPAAGSSGATANTASSAAATMAQTSKPADEKKSDDTADKVKKEIKNQLKKRLRFP